MKVVRESEILDLHSAAVSAHSFNPEGYDFLLFLCALCGCFFYYLISSSVALIAFSMPSAASEMRPASM